jgi:hypothetical protein
MKKRNLLRRWLSPMDIIVKKNKNEISQRKLEGYLKLAEIVQWGR